MLYAVTTTGAATRTCIYAALSKKFPKQINQSSSVNVEVVGVPVRGEWIWIWI